MRHAREHSAMKNPSPHNGSTKRAGEDGWGIVLVFFVLAFLIGVTLVAVRHQMTSMKNLDEHAAAHDEYWRARAFATDLEASVRADLTNACATEIARARRKEQSIAETSRLPAFDIVTEPVSRPFMRFEPQADWFDADDDLNIVVPAKTNCVLSPADPNRCTSLLGRLGDLNEQGSWLNRHALLVRAFAGRRGHTIVPKVNDLLTLRETTRELLETSDFGFDQTSYVVEYVIEVSSGAAGEAGRVRRQGRITLGSPQRFAEVIPACNAPAIIELVRQPPDPVDDGTALSFAWRTLDARSMRIELLDANDAVLETRYVSLEQPDRSYAQTYTYAAWAATLLDPDAQNGTMRFRFTALNACRTSEVRESVSLLHTINVRRLAAWAVPWSRPSGEGLRAADKFGDAVGFFQTWAQVGTNGDRVQFKVRVGYTMGDENGKKLSNSGPVYNTFSGFVTVTDADGQPVEGMTNLPLNSQNTPAVGWQYNGSQFMNAPSRGCDGRKCLGGTKPGSVMMSMEYTWSIPRPQGDFKGYRLAFNFDVRTIDPNRKNQKRYSRRGGRDDNPWFPMYIDLFPAQQLVPPGGGTPPETKPPRSDPSPFITP